MSLPFVVNLPDALRIRSIGRRGTEVNDGVGVVKKVIILQFAINLADVPRICSIGIQTPGPQALGPLNKTCSE